MSADERIPGFDAVPALRLSDFGVACEHSAEAIVLDCAQGEAEWFAARTGRITASVISDVVTSKGEPSKSVARFGHVCRLAAERLTGDVEAQHCNAAMERGTNLEPEARDWYAEKTGRDVRQVGFVYRDAGKDMGCSPDGLCADRGLEIKCLMHKAHLSALIKDKPPVAHLPQIHFSMWITGLPAWDLCMYTPECKLGQLPCRIWTIERDAKLCAAYDEHVPAFCAEVDAAVAKLRDMMA